MKMILFGQSIPAQEAQSMGLVADLYKPGTVLDNTVAVAHELAHRSSSALCLAKEAICRGESGVLLMLCRFKFHALTLQGSFFSHLRSRFSWIRPRV